MLEPTKTLFPFLIAGALLAQAPTAPPQAPEAMASIRAEQLLEHARYLASDALQGRMTGSPGQLLAAEYVSKQFAAAGLEPLGDEQPDGGRSWLQHYPIERVGIDPERTRLQFGETAFGDGFAVLAAADTAIDVSGKVRFCGLGRTRGPQAEIGEDESLADVVPVALVRPPRGNAPKNLGIEQKFGMAFSVLGGLSNTNKALARKGAKLAVFLMLDDPTGLCDVLTYLALTPGQDQLKAGFGGAMSGMGGMSAALGGDVPLLVLGPARSAAVLAELGIAPEAAAKFLQSRAPGDLPEAKADVAARARLAVVRDAQATACNVVGLLRGSDAALAAEAVVFSAHMDHMGRRMDGAIYHGADDNASGTAGLLAIAAAFGGAEQRPRRSLVFLSVSGEELGLWGSAYFASHPTWPLEAIAANVNTDMIGRSGPESGPDEVMITPSHEHRMFSTIVQDAARLAPQFGLSLLSGDKYYQRSDHYNFAKRGIPVVFFCNGEHADYHQVTDTADKLDGDKMQALARLAFWTGCLVADADERPRTLGPMPDWK